MRYSEVEERNVTRQYHAAKEIIHANPHPRQV